MIRYFAIWQELNADRRAVTSLEYALMGIMIAVAIVTAVTIVGQNLSTMFNHMGTSL